MTEDQLADLKEAIDPSANSNFYGVEIYLRVRSFVEEKMRESQDVKKYA